MAKFATPVAMKVTKEQGKYLREELTKLGYSESVINKSGYITTNWNGIYSQFAIANHRPHKRFIIEEYNPELFLAIAAMTNGDIPIKGEWLYYDRVSKIFQVKGFEDFGPYNNWRSSTISLDNPTGSGHFHKPTIQQLEEHFKISANYEPVIKQEIPEEFYVRYCEEFTEEFYEALRKWAKQNSTGPEYGYCKEYHKFVLTLYDARFNFSKTLHEGMSYAYGMDNNPQGVFITEYTIEQVKKLINYKPKINNNEYKENNCKKEIRESEQGNDKSSSSEREQVNEDLDRNSSSERGKEIKARVKRSRNLCERGSLSGTEKIARTRRTSSRIRAEKGDFNF